MLLQVFCLKIEFLELFFSPSVRDTNDDTFATGGQLDQWGAERRRPAGGSLQRSHHGPGGGGGGGRGQVGVTPSLSHSSSSRSICRFPRLLLYFARSPFFSF